MKFVWPVVVLGLSTACPSFAAESYPKEGLDWLKKMASATNQLNYSGTFVYQQRGNSETSSIAHYVNAAGGVFAKLETLDGPAREVVRSNDQVTCYLPNTKTVLIEQRNSRYFPPAVLPERLDSIMDNYTVRIGENDRVAGYECQVIELVPKDNLRYGRRFCAEKDSGLPLAVRTFDERDEPVEAFAYTQLSIGGSFSREKVRSKYAEKSRSQKWRIDRSALSINDRPFETGWMVDNQPAGFKKLMEVQRSIGGRPGHVAQIVFSDGLAAVSVFVEPIPRERPAQALSHRGAVNIYTREVADHMITVLGEAPAATVMQIGDSLKRKTDAAIR
ncbi:MAG: MucB/RseB C-terminal domain-containing protein [Betaproteobacteria bacterium]|nr:MucB/RseB C-terminal domain-containing protein [Betaproteobacteria bacterium]